MSGQIKQPIRRNYLSQPSKTGRLEEKEQIKQPIRRNYLFKPSKTGRIEEKEQIKQPIRRNYLFKPKRIKLPVGERTDKTADSKELSVPALENR
ncbi:MAG: hypothetical protein K6G69_01855 [Lachnospiraceae bacterium]|nr:hypothetical protein [Lachnospiraceae bacterium]